MQHGELILLPKTAGASSEFGGSTMPDPTPLTAETIRELETLHEAATPGKWKTWGMSVMWDERGDSNVAHAAKVANTYYSAPNGSPRTNDADLICALRNALPALLSAARELLELKAALEHLHAKDQPFANWTLVAMFDRAKQLGWHPSGLKPGGAEGET